MTTTLKQVVGELKENHSELTAELNVLGFCSKSEHWMNILALGGCDGSCGLKQSFSSKYNRGKNEPLLTTEEHNKFFKKI